MDAFDSGEAEETTGTRDNFIGRIVSSEVNASDEKFQTEYDSDVDVLYEIEVLSEDWDNVYELGLNVRESLESKFYVLVGHLENIYGSMADIGVETPADLTEFLEGKVFEFTDQDMTADENFVFEKSGREINFEDAFGDLDNPPQTMLLPVREVTDDDELSDLGAQDGADVEEVEDF